MKCCGKEMYDNGDNYHCSECNKRIYKKDLKICPQCGKEVFFNGNNVHCPNCGNRKFL